MLIAYIGKDYNNISHMSTRWHAESKAVLTMINNKYNCKKEIKITIVRYRVNNGKIELSLSLPCTHCRITLNQIAKYRFHKYGQTLKVRYTMYNQEFSPYLKINELPESSLSSGYAQKYRKIKDK